MHLLDDISAGLEQLRQQHGLPAYRAKQIRGWLFARRAADWQAMSDLPQALREKLAAETPLWRTSILKHNRSEDGTEKLLLQLEKGGQVECVLIRGRLRRTFCISTQVGCGMGCVFCASGIGGVDRNLSTGEIVEQMLRLQHLLEPDERVSHIVVMGMGEPLANLPALLPALAEASREDGLGISPRRITVSTVGLPAGIRKLAGHDPHYRLAVSLHAPNDELRNQIVPVNDKIGIQAILEAADEYFAASRRRMTFEYVLLGGLNDSPHHAAELARLLRGRETILNVIPYNPVPGLPYQTPTPAAQQAFREVLERGGVAIHFRQRKGDAINAACGQLRRDVSGSPLPVVRGP
ncbi:putative dual-specificity RNA methyltransferase RlmN [Pirellulimonas nuda]|uniref:Probable dual-specificity RNA methyltransferase RlmN n=1 Tax=Pirellulimonas nuda TaxID=2528009 RepID=A0A518D5W8_9BACT|nr:23S rRNA (adenine(2503)-C(2))-methyltransferase RlmN [Pirellulimonas nuda]QDU86865.1 putative dual-specificity RNA methyltransferase RlmN [Pirellulimonas nuda]